MANSEPNIKALSMTFVYSLLRWKPPKNLLENHQPSENLTSLDQTIRGDISNSINDLHSNKFMKLPQGGDKVSVHFNVIWGDKFTVYWHDQQNRQQKHPFPHDFFLPDTPSVDMAFQLLYNSGNIMDFLSYLPRKSEVFAHGMNKSNEVTSCFF